MGATEIGQFPSLTGCFNAVTGSDYFSSEGEPVNTLHINGKFLSQETTGVQRYASELVRFWDEGLDEGWIDRKRFSIRIHTPRTILHKPDYKHISVEAGLTNGRIWEQLELPVRARGGLLFSPYAAAPLFQLHHAVTIHDAGAAATPHQYSWLFRLYCAIVFRFLGRTCAPIFTVSEFSRSELQRYYSISTDKTSVVHPGCDHLLRVPSDSGILERHNLEKNQYVLGVSSRSVIKNFEGLAKAFRTLAPRGFKLAVAGGARRHLISHANTNHDPDIVELGYVSDGELRCLYENAALFVYPSFYEGFGIPPVEAMSCGCPVLVAQSSSLPEACADGALYCDPANPNDIAGGIDRILNDPKLAEEMRRKGKHRANELSASKAATLLWSELVPFL